MSRDAAIDMHADSGVPFALIGTCDGTEELATLWLRRLLTRPGSDPLSPDAGTSLLGALGQGFSTAVEASALASISVEQATEQVLRLQRQRNVAVSAQLAAVTLLSAELRTQGAQRILELRVQLVRRDGRSFLLPVRVPA